MKRRTGFLLLLLLIGAFSAAAQESQCLEVWDYWSGDNIRHEVNLDTGTVVSYPPPARTSNTSPSPHANSFDGRYTAQLEQNNSLGEGFRLTLIDNTVGVSFLLETYSVAFSWSPSSAWLTYIQVGDDFSLTLILYNADTGESVAAMLPEGSLSYSASITWSPDSSLLIVNFEVSGESQSGVIQLYTAPDLTLANSYEMAAFAPYFLWSPSGRYLVAHGGYEGSLLLDTQSRQGYPLTIDSIVMYRFYWSPDETYLVTSHINNDWTDAFDVVNMQGEYLLEDILINAHFDDGIARIAWLDDHRLIANTFIFDTAMSNLTFFDLQTGKQRFLVSRVANYSLSHDQRYVAATGEASYTTIRLFDFSSAEVTTNTLNVSTNIDNFIWRVDRLELIVLFEDHSLRGYDLEADTWRDIATLSGEESMMRHIACAH
jgi:hypothetical protein